MNGLIVRSEELITNDVHNLTLLVCVSLSIKCNDALDVILVMILTFTNYMPDICDLRLYLCSLCMSKLAI